MHTAVLVIDSVDFIMTNWTWDFTETTEPWILQKDAIKNKFWAKDIEAKRVIKSWNRTFGFVKIFINHCSRICEAWGHSSAELSGFIKLHAIWAYKGNPTLF